MNGALDAAEAEAASFGDSVDIGTITIACALGYMDFRYGNDNWRASRPKLAAWFEQFSKRPSLAQTMPQ
jgi:glutathione S-transferase